MPNLMMRRLGALLLCALLVSCGGKGGPAAAPSSGATAAAGDSQVTVTWTPDPGVQYWLWYVAGSSINSANPTTTPGHLTVINVTSPYVLTGLTNGTTYSFTVNGRVDGGPGGPGTPSVSAVPRPAGVTWTAGGAMGVGDMHGLAFATPTGGSATYVAAGNAGAIYTSADALTWTAVTSGTASALNAVVFTLGQFISVGAAGTIVKSTDSVTWTASTSGTAQALNAIASNGALAVAVGNAGTIRFSTDGVTWTGAATVPTANNLNGVTFASSGLWLAVGDSGTLLESTDGNTWTAVTSGTAASLKAVSFRAATGSFAATYVVVGTNIVLASADATTWSSQAVSGGLLALFPMASQFLAVGTAGSAFTSPDAVTWTAQSTGATLFGLINTQPVNGQAKYVAVGTRRLRLKLPGLSSRAGCCQFP
jgi:hypothetical protein